MRKAVVAAGFKNEKRNAEAQTSIVAWRDTRLKASKPKGKTDAKAYNQIGYCFLPMD